jgi:hypothetical protein
MSNTHRCISYKRFVLLCSCLYLMSNTKLLVEGNSSSPAEERKYLRSSRGEATIDNLLTHHTDDMILVEDEEEEEEEFDYEKFHAKHHIPLPALGALGSSSYEQQGDISNNKDKDIGEDEEEPLLMDESYMIPEEVQAAAIPQEVQKNEPPPMGQQQEDSPDSSTTTLDDIDEDDDAILEPTRRRTRKLSTADTNESNSQGETVVSKKEIISMDEIQNLSLEDMIQEVEILENELKKQARVKEEKAKAISNLIKGDLPALRAEVDFNTHLFDKAKDIGDEYINYYKPIQEENVENDVGLEF